MLSGNVQAMENVGPEVEKYSLLHLYRSSELIRQATSSQVRKLSNSKLELAPLAFEGAELKKGLEKAHIL